MPNRSHTFIDVVRSVWIWTAIILLIIFWFPLLALIRLFDQDPVRYRTGRWFRRLGVAMAKVNPAWKVEVAGEHIENPRNPYIVVSNAASTSRSGGLAM